MIPSGAEVFYPFQGAGVVEGIEKMSFTGSPHDYYKVSLNTSTVTVYVPAEKAEEMGFRRISSGEQLEDAREQFFSESAKLPANNTDRKNMLHARLSSGTIADMYQIIRDLGCTGSEGPKLNMDDKNVLAQTISLLESELMMIKHIPENKAAELVREDIRRRSRAV